MGNNNLNEGKNIYLGNEAFALNQLSNSNNDELNT
jgi:hypothetical protein